MDELAAALEGFDADPEVHCIVIAGSDEVFAAGADIKAMVDRSLEETLRHPAASFWKRLTEVKTPLLAAVSGWALGGGCELALACDLIVASETAEFGQPEITLGIIPGGGGTQRLARVLGKQRTMDLVLTGRRIDARAEAALARGGARDGPAGGPAAADRGPARQAGGDRRRRDRAFGWAGDRAPAL
jgi:enoyl-CoA hydratase/carnithine racemase